MIDKLAEAISREEEKRLFEVAVNKEVQFDQRLEMYCKELHSILKEKNTSLIGKSAEGYTDYIPFMNFFFCPEEGIRLLSSIIFDKDNDEFNLRIDEITYLCKRLPKYDSLLWLLQEGNDNLFYREEWMNDDDDFHTVFYRIVETLYSLEFSIDFEDFKETRGPIGFTEEQKAMIESHGIKEESLLSGLWETYLYRCKYRGHSFSEALKDAAQMQKEESFKGKKEEARKLFGEDFEIGIISLNNSYYFGKALKEHGIDTSDQLKAAKEIVDICWPYLRKETLSEYQAWNSQSKERHYTKEQWEFFSHNVKFVEQNKEKIERDIIDSYPSFEWMTREMAISWIEAAKIALYLKGHSLEGSYM